MHRHRSQARDVLVSLTSTKANPELAATTDRTSCRKAARRSLGYLKRFGHGILENWRHEVVGYMTNVKFAIGVVLFEAKGDFEVLGLHRTGTSDELEWE